MVNAKNFTGKNKLNVNLSFNDGWAEKPIYSLKATTTDKRKGVYMLDLITNNFSLTNQDIEEYRKEIRNEILKEMQALGSGNIYSKKREPLQLSRDEKGNLISPFASKKKLI